VKNYVFAAAFLIAVRAAFGQTEAAAASPLDAPKAKPAATASARASISSVHVNGPYIAITFDDGPHATLTPKLLDLLAAHHIKATFFVLGECIAQNPEVLKRAAREGHEIGNHSWSHPNLGKMSDDAVRSQLKRTDNEINDVIGKRPTLMRPPYGSVTSRQKRFIHDELGYEIILWDVDPLDWKRPGPSVVTSRILKETRAGSIVLVHDIHPGSIEAMPATLDQLEAKGFKFVTVSELLKMATPATPKPQAQPAAPAVENAPSPIAPAASPR